MAEYSIAQALKELKLLDKRIKKEISNLDVVDVIKGENKKTQSNETVEEFTNNTKNRYKKILDLINNRQKIQTAIMISNTQAKVKIDGIEYSVAEAIAFKQNIVFKKYLLSEIRKDYNNTTENLNLLNDQVERQLQSILESSSDKKSNEDNTKNNPVFQKTYRDMNSYKLVDPLICLEKVILPLDEEIDSFESQIDYILSESNALTKITID